MLHCLSTSRFKAIFFSNPFHCPALLESLSVMFRNSVICLGVGFFDSFWLINRWVHHFNLGNWCPSVLRSCLRCFFDNFTVWNSHCSDVRPWQLIFSYSPLFSVLYLFVLHSRWLSQFNLCKNKGFFLICFWIFKFLLSYF